MAVCSYGLICVSIMVVLPCYWSLEAAGVEFNGVFHSSSRTTFDTRENYLHAQTKKPRPLKSTFDSRVRSPPRTNLRHFSSIFLANDFEKVGMNGIGFTKTTGHDDVIRPLFSLSGVKGKSESVRSRGADTVHHLHVMNHDRRYPGTPSAPGREGRKEQSNNRSPKLLTEMYTEKIAHLSRSYLRKDKIKDKVSGSSSTHGRAKRSGDILSEAQMYDKESVNAPGNDTAIGHDKQLEPAASKANASVDDATKDNIGILHNVTADLFTSHIVTVTTQPSVTSGLSMLEEPLLRKLEKLTEQSDPNAVQEFSDAFTSQQSSAIITSATMTTLLSTAEYLPSSSPLTSSSSTSSTESSSLSFSSTESTPTSSVLSSTQPSSTLLSLSTLPSLPSATESSPGSSPSSSSQSLPYSSPSTQSSISTSYTESSSSLSSSTILSLPTILSHSSTTSSSVSYTNATDAAGRKLIDMNDTHSLTIIAGTTTTAVGTPHANDTVTPSTETVIPHTYETTTPTIDHVTFSTDTFLDNDETPLSPVDDSTLLEDTSSFETTTFDAPLEAGVAEDEEPPGTPPPPQNVSTTRRYTQPLEPNVTQSTPEERGVDWGAAKQTWQYAWEIHVYTFGALFGLLALYTVASGLRLSCSHGLLPRGYFLFINALMFLMCSTRCFYMLFDGYNSGATFHACLDYFLYSVTFPCLTSAFGLLVLAFLKASCLQLLPPSVQNIWVLMFIIVVHFILSISADVLVSYVQWVYILQFVSQIFYLVWGALLYFCYAYIYRRLYAHAQKRQKNAASTSSPTDAWVSRTKVVMKFTLSAGVKVAFFTAICGLVTVGLEAYALVDIYRTFTPGRPRPWTWWLYHTVLRVAELLMALTLTFVASLPFRYSRPSDAVSCGIFCSPCTEMCACCGHRGKARNSANRSSSFYEWHAFRQPPAGPKIPTPDSAYSLRRLDSQGEDSGRHRSSAGSRPNSLMTIDNPAVRFQTNEEVCLMLADEVPNDMGQTDDVHSMNTFHLRDSYVNANYSFYAPPHPVGVQSDDRTAGDRSRKSSMTSSEFFRGHSSVSLADSVENELDKVFESFKATSGQFVGDEMDSRSTDVMIGSTQSADLPGGSSPDSRDSPDSGSSRAPSIPSSLERQPRFYDESDNSERELSTPLIDNNADYDDDYLPPPFDPEEEHGAAFPDPDTEDFGYADHIEALRSRRPSEGQGHQAAILTSLLKSREIGSSENIDV